MDKAINWIAEERQNGTSWEELSLAGENSIEDLISFLRFNAKKNHWPVFTVETWKNLVENEKRKSEEIKTLIDEKGATVIGGMNEENTLTVPIDGDSAWQTYKRRLIRNGFGKNTVELIEDSTLKILRCLSRDTREIGTVKGLVVGNVQSGKTANMAALMAMAADYGWNMFIILSGMMENLRIQTQRRLISDLQDNKWDWEAISNPNKAEEEGKKLRNKLLSNESTKRYISVCIKNKRRLENLIEWMLYDQSPRENIRMLIIDDECDQASVNTLKDKEDRTKINNLILHLINNRSSRGKKATIPFQAVNYIGYTATPYANVLNEGPGEESLYPKDFITSLNFSDKYFGPQQIFGYDGDDSTQSPIFVGLDIIRNISEEDITEIADCQEGISDSLPCSLQNAICWFICGVAYMRFVGYQKPVSMLIHTSRKTTAHNNIAKIINQWFTLTPPSSIIELCKKIWVKEATRFSLDDFKRAFPNYGSSDGNIKLSDYPSFDELLHFITDLLKIGVTNILINNENQHLKFSNGIHLCVDNSEKSEFDNIQKRLVYPENNEMPNLAPAFLVIGGNTLSRGLTLEGLVSTYFLRPTKCADTLMQMGRWFGYRPGYELLPRIWMPQNVKDQYEFISEMDQRLRDEIRLMAQLGVSPTDCGPKIMASPSTKWLEIVSKNKRQSAIGAEYDFAGHTIETGVFDNTNEILCANLQLTKKFLTALGRPSIIKNNPYSDRNILWMNVTWNKIKEYFTSYRYASRQKGFREIDYFSKWMDIMINKGLLSNWNVILAGIKGDKNSKQWFLSDTLSINKVNRTQKTPNRADGVLNIGVLRSFNDFLSDIELPENDTQMLANIRDIKHSISALNSLRENIGLGHIPQLIIYIIDKDSVPLPGSVNRFPLKAINDIAGFSINIPGVRRTRNTIQSIQIDIVSEKDFED